MAAVPDRLRTRIGRYDVEHILWSRPHRLVLKARDPVLGRTVVIKIIPKCDSVFEHAQPAMQEGRLVAHLDHCSIVKIFDVIADRHEYALIMEFVDGISLDQILAKGPLSEQEATRVFLIISEAIRYAHSRNVIHGDLKPSNILICRNRSVKIIDFGLSRLDLTTGASPSSDMEDGGASLRGTLRYMSPELIRGGSATVQTDIFAMGAILFEMVSGQPVFPGETEAKIINGILHEPMRIPERLGHVSGDLARLTQKMLQRDHLKRLGSAADIRRSLKTNRHPPKKPRGGQPLIRMLFLSTFLFLLGFLMCKNGIL